MDTFNVNLPMFPGFDYSWLSDEIDSIEEREAEYMEEERQAEEGIPEHQRLDASEIADILMDVSDYSAMHRALAKVWVECLNAVIWEELDIDLEMTFEAMTSPKYYNFETDRVFVDIPADKVQAMFDHLKANDFAALRKTLKARHTSYDGFHSFYSNDLETWLEKPLEDWDHNEIGSLLCAFLADKWEDIEQALLYRALESDGFYSEWSDNVDWAKFDAKVAELRAEKEDEKCIADPDYCQAIAEPRCTETLELPL